MRGRSSPASVRRGKLDAALTLRAGGERQLHATLNPEFARELIGHAQTLAAAIGKTAPLNPVDILRWPGVLQEEETRLEALHPLALEGLERAVADLTASRDREGARMHELLESRCAEILTRITAVRARLPIVLTAHSRPA